MNIFFGIWMILFLNCGERIHTDTEIRAYLNSLKEEGGPLKIVSYYPKEVLKNKNPIIIRFNQAMVVPKPSHASQSYNPLRISPKISGKITWLGPKTLLFDPDKPYPASTRFVVSLSRTTQSLQGRILGRGFSWKLKSSAIEIVSSSPPNGGVLLNQKNGIVVQFNQGLLGEELKKQCQFQNNNSGKPMACIVVPVKESMQKKGYSQFNLMPASILEEGDLILKIRSGLKPAEGDFVLDKDLILHFQSRGNITVEMARCLASCAPKTEIELTLDSEIDPEFLKKSLVVDPQPKRPPTVIKSQNQRSYLLSMLSEPNQDYQLKFKGDLKDQTGRAFDAAWIFHYKTGDINPELTGPSFYWINQSFGNLSYPVFINQAQNLEVSVTELNLKSVLALLNQKENTFNVSGGGSKKEWSLDVSGSLEGALNKNILLNSLATPTSDFILVDLTAQVGKNSSQKKSVRMKSLVFLSSIVGYVFKDEKQTRLHVSKVDASPSEAKVFLLNAAGSPLWEGKTDFNGELLIPNKNGEAWVLVKTDLDQLLIPLYQKPVPILLPMQPLETSMLNFSLDSEHYAPGGEILTHITQFNENRSVYDLLLEITGGIPAEMKSFHSSLVFLSYGQTLSVLKDKSSDPLQSLMSFRVFMDKAHISPVLYAPPIPGSYYVTVKNAVNGNILAPYLKLEVDPGMALKSFLPHLLRPSDRAKIKLELDNQKEGEAHLTTTLMGEGFEVMGSREQQLTLNAKEKRDVYFDVKIGKANTAHFKFIVKDQLSQSQLDIEKPIVSGILKKSSIYQAVITEDLMRTLVRPNYDPQFEAGITFLISPYYQLPLTSEMEQILLLNDHSFENRLLKVAVYYEFLGKIKRELFRNYGINETYLDAFSKDLSETTHFSSHQIAILADLISEGNLKLPMGDLGLQCLEAVNDSKYSDDEKIDYFNCLHQLEKLNKGDYPMINDLWDVLTLYQKTRLAPVLHSLMPSDPRLGEWLNIVQNGISGSEADVQEQRAHLLHSLVLIFPDHPLVSQLASLLLDERLSAPLESTTRYLLIRSLGKLIDQKKGIEAIDSKAMIQRGNQILFEADFSQEGAERAQAFLPYGQMAGKESLLIRKEGETVFYVEKSSFVPNLSDWVSEDYGMILEKSMDPLYYGKKVIIKHRIVTDYDEPIQIQDPLPSGVVYLDDEVSKAEGCDLNSKVVSKTFEDGYLVVKTSGIDRGYHEYCYNVMPFFPGDYWQGPLQVSSITHPNHSGLSIAGRIQINP